MAFFSVVNELVAGLVGVDRGEDIRPRYTAMHSTFTQIYDKTKGKVEQILDSEIDESSQRMPPVTHPLETLNGIVTIDIDEKP